MQESDFRGETRKDFFIRPMIQRAWAAQLKMLQEIDKICKRHGLTWFMDSGTLLGAVRENGYIPWDDDLDIGMLRPDFERFRRYAREELPKGYYLANDRQTGQQGIVFGVKNSDRICLDTSFLEEFYGCPYALCVDVFVYDAVPDDPEEKELYLQLFSRAFLAGESLRENMDLGSCPEEIQGWIKELEKLLNISIGEKGDLKGELLRLADHIAAMYYEENTKEVSVAWYRAQSERYAIRREWMERVTYLPFEGMVLPAPIGYKEVLKVFFGEDYMTPRREYTYHSYPYFKEQEEKLHQYFQECGEAVPEMFRE